MRTFRDNELLEILDLARKDHEIAERNHNILLRILEHLKPKPITRKIAVKFTGESMNNALVLTVGQTSIASLLEFLSDGVTPSGGVPSNVVFAFSDPSATVVLNADGVTATVTGVSASVGPVTGTVSFTVTDTDGAVSQWNQSYTITTNAVVPPAQLTQSVAVAFSTPA
jgi:hypothetical protein